MVAICLWELLGQIVLRVRGSQLQNCYEQDKYIEAIIVAIVIK
jgi:hypothetical protein